MNLIAQVFKKSIINKVIFLVALVLISVGGIIAVDTISFFEVKDSLELIIDRDVSQFINITRANNNLANKIASSNLLIHTFTDHENTFEEEKNNLTKEIKADITALKIDDTSAKNSFQKYIKNLNMSFDHCTAINAILKELNTTENYLDNKLSSLDEIVIEKELTVVVEDSEEAESLKQLAIMLPGYREIFFEIIIELIHAKNDYLGIRKIKYDYEQKILSLLEEFEIGLSAMPIAWKEIIPYVRSLMDVTSQYKLKIANLFKNLREFYDHIGELTQLEKQITTEISRINNQIIKNTYAIRNKTSDTITSSIRTTVLLSSIVVIILFFIGFFIVSLIQPVKKLSVGAEKIGAGDLNYKVTIDSKDEIGQLADSFNRMTQNLRHTTVSKEYIQNILKSMNEALIVLNLEGNIQTVNQSTLDLLGYEIDDLVGEPVGKIFEGTEGKNITKNAINHKSEIEALIEQRFIKNIEKSYLGKGGRLIPVLFSASAMFDDDGNIIGIVCVASDITARKQAEAALSISETNYRHLFNSEPDAIIIVDAETKRIVDVNPAALKLYGYGYDEICELQAVALSAEPEKSASHIRQVLSENSTEGPREIVKRMHKKKDGTLFPVEIGHGFYTRDGRKMICAVMRDISKRKQIEDELASEKERLAVTLRSIGDGVISTDIHGKINSINKVAEQLTGWKEKDAIGRPLTEIFHIINEFDRKRCEDPVHKVIETGGIVGLANNTLLISKDGKEHVIADSGAPIRDIENEIIGAVLVFRDITEKRKIEAELVNAQKLESLGILAGGIAHDFNNFLTAIIGNLSLARLDSKPGDRVVVLLNEMEKASLQAKDLTQQLLTFSKGGEPVKKLVDLAELVKNSAGFSLRGSNVRCDFKISDDLLGAEVDEGQIGQVINNLVLNADQAMPDGGILEICSENITLTADNPYSLLAGPYIKTSIRDHGVGIGPDHLHKVFDPYFTTKQKGSGLGLTVAYSIVDKHNGRMTVESELGHGTTFTMYLPASEKPTTNQDYEKDRLFFGKGKILVMDDEEFIRDLAIQMLSKIEYDVSVAHDGDETIEMYRQAQKSGEPFDIVIMDLTIPGGMGGKETIRKLRELDPKVKALVSSGYSNDPIMSNFRDYGFQGVVKKPYRIQEMSDALRSVLKVKAE